jgi:hypothetical protein
MTVSEDAKPPDGDALDQLEYEDRALEKILEEFERSSDRLEHGVAGKLFVEHLAVREAARETIATALEADGVDDALADIGKRLADGTERRRRALVRLDELARGIQPINLNQGQDFDAAVEEVSSSLRGEIASDLNDLLPRLRAQIGSEQRRDLLPAARTVRKHAPTHPHPGGRRWYERFRPLVRLHAVYDWVRGFPTGGAVPMREVDLPVDDNKPL